MIVEGKTDAGLVRKTNQDDFACGLYGGGAGAWAVVCDGMGGVSGGSVASGRAVKLISGQLAAGPCPGRDEAKKLLLGALEAANADVFRAGAVDPLLRGMGTTVVACVASGSSAYIAHAGDSRAYIISKSGVVLLTRDHSIVQEMLESGKIGPEEAQMHPQRNIITRALGVDETLEIDYCEATFASGASLLLCTDGLTNTVGADEIGDTILGGGDRIQKLVDLANGGGGADNITVVVIDNKQKTGE